MLENEKEIISRLKFIGRLNKNEKINTRFMYVQANNMTTTIIRTIFYQDNRYNTLNFIDDTINKIFGFIDSYKNSDKNSAKAICKNIIIDLKQSKIGMCNLKDTYKLDIKFCCDIDTFMENIDTKLLELEPLFSIDEEKVY